MWAWQSFLFLALTVINAHSFIVNAVQDYSTSLAMDPSSSNESHPFCLLPGDPSLILTTNVDLGDKKMEIMKGEIL
jgi:hypothetical protein